MCLLYNKNVVKIYHILYLWSGSPKKEITALAVVYFFAFVLRDSKRRIRKMSVWTFFLGAARESLLAYVSLF